MKTKPKSLTEVLILPPSKQKKPLDNYIKWYQKELQKLEDQATNSKYKPNFETR